MHPPGPDGDLFYAGIYDQEGRLLKTVAIPAKLTHADHYSQDKADAKARKRETPKNWKIGNTRVVGKPTIEVRDGVEYLVVKVAPKKWTPGQ